MPEARRRPHGGTARPAPSSGARTTPSPPRAAAPRENKGPRGGAGAEGGTEAPGWSAPRVRGGSWATGARLLTGSGCLCRPWVNAVPRKGPGRWRRPAGCLAAGGGSLPGSTAEPGARSELERCRRRRRRCRYCCRRRRCSLCISRARAPPPLPAQRPPPARPPAQPPSSRSPRPPRSPPFASVPVPLPPPLNSPPRWGPALLPSNPLHPGYPHLPSPPNGWSPPFPLPFPPSLCPSCLSTSYLNAGFPLPPHLPSPPLFSGPMPPTSVASPSPRRRRCPWALLSVFLNLSLSLSFSLFGTVG